MNVRDYMGLWYELAHYPTWFERSDSYNTTAHYTAKEDGTVQVHNASYILGRRIEANGVAKYLGSNCFRVDFGLTLDSRPNYIIDKLWLDNLGNYLYAVVTNPGRDNMFILSRLKHPSAQDYAELLNYVAVNFDITRLVHTAQL